MVHYRVYDRVHYRVYDRVHYRVLDWVHYRVLDWVPYRVLDWVPYRVYYRVPHCVITGSHTVLLPGPTLCHNPVPHCVITRSHTVSKHDKTAEKAWFYRGYLPFYLILGKYRCDTFLHSDSMRN